MGGQVAIVKLSARYAEITKTLNFLVVRLSGFTVAATLVSCYTQQRFQQGRVTGTEKVILNSTI